MAHKWQEFQANKDIYPNLKYVTTGDKRVRDKHKAWDGFVAPIDHPIWKKLLPPNDWGCRCDVIQTDEPVTKGFEKFANEIKSPFANNPVFSGKIFADVPYASGLTSDVVIAATQKALLFGLQKASKPFQKHLERAIYELPRKWQFQEVYRSGKGKVLKHLLAKETAEDYVEVLQSAKLFADDFDDVVEILPIVNDASVKKYRKKIFPNYTLNTNPDLRINGTFYDVKRTSAIKNIQGNANEASSKQGAFAIIYLKENVKITEAVLERRVKDIFKSKYYNHNKVYFIINGKLKKYNRHQK